MSRLIPTAIDDRTPHSERGLLELFKRELPHEWIVLHGQRVAVAASGVEHLTEVEVDIILVDPRRGILCIEVKGGEVVRESGQWYSSNRNTAQRHEIKNPGKQALAASHSLAEFLRGVPARVLPGGCPPFAWAVALPDVAVAGGLGADLPRELLIDKGDLRDVKGAIDRIFAHALGATISPFDADAVVRAIAPDFKLAPLLRSQVDDQEAILVRLTEEQLDIVEGLDGMTRIAVQGPAGTGKTLVATARAARLASRGAKVLMLCYNAMLAEHISRSTKGFAVHTFHSLCHHLCERAAVPFVVPQSPELQQKFFEEDSVTLLDGVLDLLPDARYDAIIVDEGQDFRSAWWPVVEKILCDRQSGHLWVFWDPHQNIFHGEADLAQRLGLPTFRLSLNCRNSRPIADFAYSMVGAIPKLRLGAPDTPPVHQVACRSAVDTRKAVTAALDKLVGGGLKPEQIVVLSPRGTRTSEVWRNRPLGRHRLEEFEKPRRTGESGRVVSASQSAIRFGTLQSFKGLEADAVVLCEVQKAKSPEQLYVAASRAKHVLYYVEEVSACP